MRSSGGIELLDQRSGKKQRRASAEELKKLLEETG